MKDNKLNKSVYLIDSSAHEVTVIDEEDGSYSLQAHLKNNSINLLDSSNNVINPSTVEKQDEIKEAIESIRDTNGVKKINEPVEVSNIERRIYNSSDTVINPATEEKQNEIKTVVESIKDSDGIKKISEPVEVSNIERRIYNSSDVVINPATEEKQVEIITKLGLGDYLTNDFDDYSEANIMYIGKEKKNGTWLILKVDMNTGTVVRGASEKNNASYTDYLTAWANRTSLVYDYLKEVI